MNEFKLIDYLDVAKAIAAKNGTTADEGLKMLIANLAIMREFYEGADRNFDYGALGQQWNALKSTERITQIRKAEQLINRPQTGGVKL